MVFPEPAEAETRSFLKISGRSFIVRIRACFLSVSASALKTSSNAGYFGGLPGAKFPARIAAIISAAFSSAGRFEVGDIVPKVDLRRGGVFGRDEERGGNFRVGAFFAQGAGVERQLERFPLDCAVGFHFQVAVARDAAAAFVVCFVVEHEQRAVAFGFRLFCRMCPKIFRRKFRSRTAFRRRLCASPPRGARLNFGSTRKAVAQVFKLYAHLGAGVGVRMRRLRFRRKRRGGRGGFRRRLRSRRRRTSRI